MEQPQPHPSHRECLAIFFSTSAFESPRRNHRMHDLADTLVQGTGRQGSCTAPHLAESS